jgi:6-phosphogluconolactonase
VAAGAGRYEVPYSAAGDVVVEVCADEAAAAARLVQMVAEAAAAAIAARGVFTLAIPGGSVLKALQGLREAAPIDWSRVRARHRPCDTRISSLQSARAPLLLAPTPHHVASP